MAATAICSEIVTGEVEARVSALSADRAGTSNIGIAKNTDETTAATANRARSHF
jgi:hypothetical protein